MSESPEGRVWPPAVVAVVVGTDLAVAGLADRPVHIERLIEAVRLAPLPATWVAVPVPEGDQRVSDKFIRSVQPRSVVAAWGLSKESDHGSSEDHTG